MDVILSKHRYICSDVGGYWYCMSHIHKNLIVVKDRQSVLRGIPHTEERADDYLLCTNCESVKGDKALLDPTLQPTPST
jgi:hypothetical protein